MFLTFLSILIWCLEVFGTLVYIFCFGNKVDQIPKQQQISKNNPEIIILRIDGCCYSALTWQKDTKCLEGGDSLVECGFGKTRGCLPSLT